MNKTAQAIEAILFFKGEPVSISFLARMLKKTDVDIASAIRELKEGLHDHGMTLMEKDDEIALRTAGDHAALIADMKKEELTRDLGKAGLETLSIILYRGPATRAEIDFIRGVNSTFILRGLLIRGLVEKIPNPKDARGFLYRPTFELLAYLGVSSVAELPQYDTVKGDITTFETAHIEKEDHGDAEE
ncbi:hypothetical protein A3D62_00490 [Candidatus Kaiserbacteria bacterium RIFCSPHIGHO2_02_FULL_49_11]|uniref:SMC-Scp complex subunit ScpB n=1 Tax=Candidatus Kaiserbacteria bacterium RIFCSPHIGHO2_02_FULL_49_11 TaxID=1798489 RepID=A0A1F6CYY5_9BACT|nr:MAG: hypothetical protein A3D62_00490 [Candidatus Kaiserbacteria bacterium RIFCSPHIGHO2_02_FULL_49_11]